LTASQDIPTTVSIHGVISPPVAVVICCNGLIAGLSELLKTKLIGHQVENIPRAVRRSKHCQFRSSVIVKVGRLRNIFNSSKADSGEKAALVDAVKTSGAKGYWQKKLDINFDEQISGPFGKAMLYARLNDRDKTFEYLEKAFAVRDAAISYLKIRPEFDNTRSDPRFADLVRRVGLPQ